MVFDKSKETKEQRKARKAQHRAAEGSTTTTCYSNCYRKQIHNVEINVLCVRFGNKYGQDYVSKTKEYGRKTSKCSLQILVPN